MRKSIQNTGYPFRKLVLDMPRPFFIKEFVHVIIFCSVGIGTVFVKKIRIKFAAISHTSTSMKSYTILTLIRKLRIKSLL